jgi:hypothetical protein
LTPGGAAVGCVQGVGEAVGRGVTVEVNGPGVQAVNVGAGVGALVTIPVGVP